MIVPSPAPPSGTTPPGAGSSRGPMAQDHRIFLTPPQARAAIRADLFQYAPQKTLFRSLCPILLGRHTVAGENDDDGVWIETGRLGKMRKITWEALRRRLGDAVMNHGADREAVAALLSRVFETPAAPGRDAAGRQGLWLDTGMAGFACRLCGDCCRHLDYHEQCTVADVRRWRLAGRDDLIARTLPVRSGGRIDHYRIWSSADGRAIRQTCPWLRPQDGGQFVCGIHDQKPGICREYPGSRKHALMTGCRGFGPDTGAGADAPRPCTERERA